MVRSLVEAIVLIPEDGRLRVEVRDQLASILAIGKARHSKRPGVSVGAPSVQVKMVAGIGFEPMTFRL